MDNLNVIEREVSEKKPQRRMCPRCHSHNTKFCYYSNHDLSQPRYTCKHCHRCWTHGGAFKNVPVGGRGQSTKRQPSVSQVNSVENHFGSLPVVLALPAQSAPPMECMDVSDGSIHRGYYVVGSNGANLEDPNKRNQRFSNTMNMNHNAMIKNNNNNNNNNNV